MKRAVVFLAVVVMFVGLALALVVQRPRRPRPDGFDAPWAGLPLLPERDWATDPPKRDVVQAVFLEANEQLTHCNQEHWREEAGSAAKLELLFAQEARGMQLLFVRAEPDPALPALLLPCFEQALEKASPVPTAGLAGGTRWRISVHLLIHPAGELPPESWWHRYVPQSWRSGGDSAIHIG